VKTLEGIRNDVAIRIGNKTRAFVLSRSRRGSLHGTSRSLLQRADALKEPAEIQALLREARGTSELLKSRSSRIIFRTTA
jgi:hypothetical protein